MSTGASPDSTKPSAGHSDAALVAATRDNDAAAFGVLYDRYADRVHAFCFSRLRNDSDSADALQETFINAHWRLHQLDDPAKFRPWLFAIARNTIVDIARARGRHERRRDWGPIAGGRHPTNPLLLEIDAEMPAPDRAMIAAESAELLWDAASGLQPRDQELLELHLREGLDGSDLARAMGVEPAHVYVMVKRMRTRLSTAVGSLLVARIGRNQCVDLDTLLRDWDGRFSLSIRSTITRHVESCDTCHETRRAAVVWETIAAAMPAAPAPAAVRLAVMAAVSVGAIGFSAGAGGDVASAAATPPAPDPEPPVADVEVEPESSGGSDDGANISGGAAAGSGVPGVLLTAVAYLVLAVVVTAGVLAVPVLGGSDDPDLVVTNVAGLTESATTPAGDDGGANDGGDNTANNDSAGRAGDDPDLVTLADATTTTTTTAPNTLIPSTSLAGPVPTSTIAAPSTAAPTTEAPSISTTQPATTTIAPTTTTTPANSSSTPVTSTPITSIPTTSIPTTSTPITSTTSTSTTTTTAPPAPAIFLGDTTPIVFPAGVVTADYTFSNVGGTAMSWAAMTTPPFGVSFSKGTLLPGESFTLQITFDATQPPDDYSGILDLNTDGGDHDIALQVLSPPTVALSVAPTSVVANIGRCADGQVGLPNTATLTAVVTDNGAVVSVIAYWNNGLEFTPMTQPAGTLDWVTTVGPYEPVSGSMLDSIVVTATDDDANSTSQAISLAVDACP